MKDLRLLQMIEDSKLRSASAPPRWLFLFAALGLGITGCGGRAEDAALDPPRALPVRTATVERRDLEEVLRLTGTLRPRSQVEVVAEVAARLVQVLKEEGQRVAADETLARLDQTDYRLATQRAQASLAVAQANQAHAVAEKERAANLLKTGGITDKDNLSAQVSLQVAEASLAEALVSVAIAEQQLARTEIKAPFAGRIARRRADTGAMLSSGEALFTLVDDAVLEFRAAVPSADWGRIRIGDPVELSVDALAGFAASGKVARIAPLVDERTRSFEVVVEVPGGGQLVGGLFARAGVRIAQVRGALVVPPAALIRDGAQPGSAEAFVVTAGKAERRTLSLGIEISQAVQVTKGLELGELVILDPPAALGADTPVEIQTRPAGAPAT